MKAEKKKAGQAFRTGSPASEEDDSQSTGEDESEAPKGDKGSFSLIE